MTTKKNKPIQPLSDTIIAQSKKYMGISESRTRTDPHTVSYK